MSLAIYVFAASVLFLFVALAEWSDQLKYSRSYRDSTPSIIFCGWAAVGFFLVWLYYLGEI